MKKVLCFVLLLAALGAAEAQNFTAVNADGVSLNYSVMNDSACMLKAGDYSGAIVVPSQVEYNGSTYWVTKVENTIFRYNRKPEGRTQVDYLNLPASITVIGYQCFEHASFDSIRLNSTVPPAVDMTNRPIFDENMEFPVYVPCGCLQRYHSFNNIANPAVPRLWGRAFSMLRSDCSVPVMVVEPDRQFIVYQDGYYEIGDTAVLTTLDSSECYTGQYSMRFIGWSDGCMSRLDTFVVTGPDTIWMLASEIAPEQLDGNNLSITVTPSGSLGTISNIGYHHIPAEGELGTICSSSLWVSGLTADDDAAQGRVHTSAQLFKQTFLPGPLRVTDAGTTAETALQYNRTWKVSREMIDDFIAHVGEAGYTIPEAISTWPGNGDTTAGYAAQLAPYYDANGDGRYNPRNGDYPLIRGEQAIFAIFNDAQMHEKINCRPMGIEVHAMYYLFNDPDQPALNNTFFADYTIYNRSQNDYRNTRLSAFADLDIGNGFDDYAGCNVQRNYFYCLNGSDTDMPGYDSVVPVQNCQMLRLSGAGEEVRPMESFVAFENSSNATNGTPNTGIDFYRLAHGMWKNGKPIYYGLNGVQPGEDSIVCRYMYPSTSDTSHYGTYGIPVEPWDELSAGNAYGDRRGVASTGDFTMEAGQAYRLSIAYTAGFPTAEQTAYAVMNGYTAHIQQIFNRDTTDRGIPFTYMPYSAPREDSGIERASAAQQLALYPNPATAHMAIQGLAAGSEVRVYSMQGCLVLSERYNGSSLDVSSLAKGIYMVATPQGCGKLCKR